MAIKLGSRSTNAAMPPVDWHALAGSRAGPSEATSFARRVRWCGGLFTLLLALVFAHVIRLEQTEGAAFRAEARRPLERRVLLPASRGRILARDATVFAHDVHLSTLEVHYRYLESPHNPAWLRRQARVQLTRAERNDPQQLAAAQQEFEQEIDSLHEQLARWCNVSPARLERRCQRIQQQVEAVHRQVNLARIARWEREVAADASAIDPAWPWHRRWRETLVRSFTTAGPPRRPREIAVAEEVAYHPLAWDIDPQVVREIEHHPEKYPGVRIGEQVRRIYPQQSAAAHLVGHVGNQSPETDSEGEAQTAPNPLIDPNQPVGLLGIESACELQLRGQPGELLEYTDPRGRVLNSVRERAPRPGQDITLSIDLELQQIVEQLLDSALLRRAPAPEVAESGGAIVVLDVHSGDVLAAASGPRFDPSLFVQGNPDGGESSHELAALLSDPRRPLFDRTIKMALPPGSVMKVITAAAALQYAEDLTADERIHCRGYLYDPDSLRCAIFRRDRQSHGPINLADALASSCNVYFFKIAERATAIRLAQMATTFGLGQPTGIELPGESAGNLPGPHATGWEPGDLYQLAIGQGAVTATPLQIACVMAALANGGHLVTPRALLDCPAEAKSSQPRRAGASHSLPRSSQSLQLDPATLAAIRRGMIRTAHEPHGTAFEALGSSPVRMAVKTGTAQPGAHRREHAWLAGFAPAEAPRVAIVVVLEHAGNAGAAAGPVFDRVVQQVQSRGYLESRMSTSASGPAP